MRDLEVPDWIKGLPLAPEFCPTDTEFADPIAYISKIEKEASVFGICKIVPPVPKPSKKYVVNNLNKSLAKRPELGTASKPVDVCSTSSAVFTTRQQELGQNDKSAKNVVHKQVWQSGEVYTLDQFESKAKAFARGQLGDIKTVSPLVIETLFWEAACEKPIYVEYANDVPGSGFGEPTGLCRFLNNRRKRRTTFRRSCGGICANTSTIDSSEMVPNLSIKKELRNSENGDEVDGSAGWKLSNSPWNLQVFSRSLGSLTRFMADDIPGVTSPMVYIGMLYSWFAWHVEDHELHSMNFLHTGSPKTWYAVPGKYAIPFEEVVRKQAYGAEVDRLASLTMLGEKTTLLSPEAIVESGIPCCRLVQNPGEFVVTFPRAYHVGFSHGFNCGEAANFGTPKWLEVAKEAAVRRAAMNCLPMLSHQQLLYLLTMSFVSRVPRSLLPGARSSRLRDRQKDERELSVKKAFLYDVLNENKLLTIVLSRSGSNRVVLWDLDSLPSFAKLPELCNTSDTNAAPEENVLSENKNNQDLLRDMNLYMENVDDFYMDNDDLSSDFQLFSGSLACVACGVLGFPFMSVVQPSVRASVNLMQDAGVLKHDRPDSPPVAYGIIDPVSDGVTDNTELGGSNLPYYSNGESSSGKSIKIMADSSVNLSTSHDPSPLEVSKDSQEPQVEKGWSSTKGFLRPRIFCLEHAVHIRDLLHSKGGANVLVICHSDFKKMEAHAAVIKEQVGSPFRYKEAPLDNATQCDLNLIDLAIDGEEHDESGKDWTSRLGINLQHCVKTRKTSPCKPDQHALTLGGLFSDTYSSANIFDLKWPLTKSRSKCIVKKSSELIKTGKPGLGNLSESMGREKGQFLVVKSDTDSMGREKGQFLVVKSDTDNIRNEHKLIQYSRRKFKCKAGDSIVKTDLAKQVHDEASVADTGDHNEHSSDVYSNSVVNIGSKGKESSGLGISASNGICESTVYVMSQATCSVTPGGQNTQYSTCDDLEMQHESEVDRSTVETITFSAENFVCSAVVAAEDPQCTFIQKENMGLVNIEPSCCSDSVTAMSETQREEVEKLSENVEEGDCVEKQHNQKMNGDKENEWVPSTDTLTDRVSVVSKDASLEISITDAVEESETQHEPEVDKGTDTILIFSAENSACSVVLAAEDPQRSIISPSSCSDSVTTLSEAQREEREIEKLSENVEGDCVEKQDIQGTNGDRENVRVLSTDTLTDRSSVVSKDASVEITKTDAVEAMHIDGFHSSPDNAELENYGLTKICQKLNTKERRKRGREPDLQVDNPNDFDGYIRSPCEGLRPRSSKHTKIGGIDTCKVVKEKNASKASTKPSNNPLSLKDNTENVKGSHRCDIENQIDKEKPQSKISTKPSKSSLSRKDKKGIGKGSHMYGIVSKSVGEKPELIKSMKLSNGSRSRKDKKENKKRSHTCDLENCQMRFYTKDALKLHKSNKCPHKGCGKKFSSHVNTVRHQRVHIDDRPLKCPWKGCHKSFKWGWSRVEHMRLHTGERPYSCKIEGCDLTFRFISDFSRHRRKTGHYVNP